MFFRYHCIDVTFSSLSDVEITCDADSMVDVHYAGEVIIRCQATSPDAEYRWTKVTQTVFTVSVTSIHLFTRLQNQSVLF